MSKDKIIFSFEDKILFVILLFLCIFPFQLKNAFATDTSNYLPVCDNWDELVKKDESFLKSQGYWVNYPFKQDGVSKECLPRQYCSDIIEGSHGRKKGSFLKGTDGQIEYQEVDVNVCISKDFY